MKQLYLEADDEITAIISKIESIGSDTIALIPPKRSTTLQSAVNLKLLKKAATSVDSKLVIVTRDPSILNVASQLKLLTAPNLETDPSVPEPTTTAKEMPSATIDGTQPTDADFQHADTGTAGIKEDEKSAGKKIAKKKRVPDFDRFKKRIFIGLAVLLLILAGVWAFFNLMPQAVISVEGRTEAIEVDFLMELDPTTEESSIDEATLATQSRQIQRTLTRSFDATGERTVGERATGQINITNCENSTSITIPSGTALTTSSGLTYRTDESVQIPGSSFSGGGNFCSEEGQESVPVTADEIGEDYNIGPTSYSVEGYPSENVFGSGGDMSGGSEEQISVVAQSDIDDAQASALEDERETALDELRRQFSDEDYIIEASFTETVDDVSAEPSEGEEASEGRIILQVTYTLLAVTRSDLEDLLGAQYKLEAGDAEGLTAIDSGLDTVEISETEDDLIFAVDAEGILGPDLDIENLKELLAGEHYQDAIDIIEDRPNVTRVQIDLDPFWTSSVPQNPERIDISFEVAGLDDEDTRD